MQEDAQNSTGIRSYRASTFRYSLDFFVSSIAGRTRRFLVQTRVLTTLLRSHRCISLCPYVPLRPSLTSPSIKYHLTIYYTLLPIYCIYYYGSLLTKEYSQNGPGIPTRKDHFVSSGAGACRCFLVHPLSKRDRNIQRACPRSRAKETGDNNVTEGSGQGSAGLSAMAVTNDTTTDSSDEETAGDEIMAMDTVDVDEPFLRGGELLHAMDVELPSGF